MSELTRKEKALKIHNEGLLSYYELCFKTDQEINDLYDQHFNQVTEEDFEGFLKVMNKFGAFWIRKGCSNYNLEEIKKELNL